MTGKFSSLAVAVFLLAIVPAAFATEPILAAKVNTGAITEEEFNRNLKPYLQSRGLPMGHEGKDNATMAPLKKELLDLLIGQELLYQEAVKKKLQPDAKFVDDEFAKIRGQFPSNEAFQAALKQNGMTEPALKDLIGRKKAVQTLVENEIAKDVAVSDSDVHDFYLGNSERFKVPEQVRARHVLVKVEEKADQATKDAARKKIDGLLKEAKGGADFAELAKNNSDCPSAKNGGDLGMFGRGQMVKPFEDVAFALKQGDLSDVVQTQFGYHIIKVEEHKVPSTVPESDVAPRIREFLKQEKMSEAVRNHVESLRKEAKVEILMKLE